MSLPTLVDEWAEAARTLAAHHDAEAAQRHGRFKAHQLPDLSKWPRATLAIGRLHRVIRGLMFDMRLYSDCGAGLHAAKALASLADALQALPLAEAPPEVEAPALRYNPGMGA